MIDTLTSFFDEEEIVEMYARDRAKEAAKDAFKEVARNLFQNGQLSFEQIAAAVPSLSADELQQLQAETRQPR